MEHFSGEILTDERVEQYLSNDIWTSETFIDVFKKDVAAYPLLVHKDEHQSMTYRDMWTKMEALAAGFYKLGIRKGDHIGLQLSNNLDYVLAVLAAARIGAVSVLLQIDLGEEALRTSLLQSQVKILITADSYRGQDLWRRDTHLISSIARLTTLIVQGNETALSDDVIAFSSLKNSGDKLPDAILEQNAPKPLDPFMMAFTSGTTGSPKGVVHLHANYLWAARAYIRNFNYAPGDCVLTIAPIAHQTGMLAGIMMTIVSGGRIALLDRFSAQRVFQWIVREQAAFIISAPPHVTHLAHAPGLQNVNTSSVKLLIYAGSPVPSTVLNQLQEKGRIHVGCLFGWTEGFVATLTKPNDPVEAVSHTVGFAVPGVEIRLVNALGQVVAQGETGEMWSRGPNFCAGYYQLPEAARARWDDDGWFHSGDLLYQDKDKRYHFVGRADDIINRGGTKIDPKSVEDVVSGFPNVESVNVVGVPHPKLGQQTVACLILKKGSEPFTLQSLRTYLGTHGLGKFQYPDRLEFFTNFPRTSSGKPQKNILKKWVIKRLNDEKQLAN
ncbi:MAG: class I adenylate-forming enzyme family protein [Sporolactobacillus sp.]